MITIVSLIILVTLSMLLLIFSIEDMKEGNYSNALTQILFLCIFLYFIVRAMNKVSKKVDPIIRATRQSLFMVIITDKYVMVNYGYFVGTFPMDNIKGFESVSNEEEKSLYIIHTTHRRKLIQLPIHYTENLKYPVNLSDISITLNQSLKDFKPL